MKNNLLETIFRLLSIIVGCGSILLVAPYINEFYVQKQYIFFTGKVLGFFSSLVVGIVVGVIFYLLYFLTRKIVEKIKSKKK